MRTFYENLKAICKARGTTVTSTVLRMGCSSSMVTTFAHGSLPKQDVLWQLADTLNCRPSDFFADDDPILEGQPDADEADLVQMFRKLGRRDRHRFMAMALTFKPETENKEVSE